MVDLIEGGYGFGFGAWWEDGGDFCAEFGYGVWVGVDSAEEPVGGWVGVV